MIQNFSNKNAEQVFLGTAAFFNADSDVTSTKGLTVDLRYLDAISTEQDIKSIFRERIQEIEPSEDGTRFVVAEPTQSAASVRIEFRLWGGDVYDLNVNIL